MPTVLLAGAHGHQSPDREAIQAALSGALPDWRIVCFFVANKRRRHGIASAALAGALEQIEKAGGGLVVAQRRPVFAGYSFLYGLPIAAGAMARPPKKARAIMVRT